LNPDENLAVESYAGAGRDDHSDVNEVLRRGWFSLRKCAGSRGGKIKLDACADDAA
jgi:hypothetical protein